MPRQNLHPAAVAAETGAETAAVTGGGGAEAVAGSAHAIAAAGHSAEHQDWRSSDAFWRLSMVSFRYSQSESIHNWQSSFMTGLLLPRSHVRSRGGGRVASQGHENGGIRKRTIRGIRGSGRRTKQSKSNPLTSFGDSPEQCTDHMRAKLAYVRAFN